MKTVSSTDGTNASSDPITSVNTEVASCSKNQPSSSTSKQPRVQQMRVDDCLSLNRMPKAEAQNNSSKKITDVPVKSQITLKQLLNNKSTDEVHTSDPTRDEADSYSFSQTLGPQTSFKDLDLHNLVKRMRENTEHVCDLGIEWYSQISNDLSPSAIDSKIIKLRARRTGYCDPNSYPLSIPERPRIIFHIDMDCFFVSVALHNLPLTPYR
ncbi:unnamed protein product [Heterobilharzia americana]|nr:unnamed protein product [Heterobilharzia americana]